MSLSETIKKLPKGEVAESDILQAFADRVESIEFSRRAKGIDVCIVLKLGPTTKSDRGRFNG